MATSYFPTNLNGTLNAITPVAIVSPGASEVWCVHSLKLTSTTGVTVSAIITLDALELTRFDIPPNDEVEKTWGGPGQVINPSSVLSVQVDVASVINYTVNGLLGTIS